jgi:hypothetical protein
VSSTPHTEPPSRESAQMQSAERRGPLREPQERPRIHLAWLVVPCLAAVGLMVPATSLIAAPVAAPMVIPLAEVGLVIALGIVGCVLAQGNLLAAWLVWSAESFQRRFWSHWKIATALLVLWLVGLTLVASQDRELPQVAATVALGVPLVSLAAQTPLWIARQWFGWRLVRVTGDGPLLPREPALSIRDLFLATLVVAASLALARLAPGFQRDSERWIAWSIAFTIAATTSTVAMLPAAALLLRPAHFRRSLIAGSLYAAAWIGLVWIAVAICLVLGLRIPPRVAFVGLSSLMFAFAATTILTAAIAHERGYRLAVGRTRDAAIVLAKRPLR